MAKIYIDIATVWELGNFQFLRPLVSFIVSVGSLMLVFFLIHDTYSHASV